jgi:predicted site-specific integrase-resolvase
MARRLLRAREAAEYLEVSTRTLYEWTKSRHLAHYDLQTDAKSGRGETCLRWSEDDLERYLRTRRKSARKRAEA